MKRIKIQDKSNLSKTRIRETIVIFIICCIFIVLPVYLITLSTKFLFYAVIFNLILSYILARTLKQIEKEYVSELLLTNRDITIVYKFGKNIIRSIIINLCDIKYFKIGLLANIKPFRNDFRKKSKLRVIIRAKNNKIAFSVQNRPSDYSLMLQLLNFQNHIPNFSYQVGGNDEGIKADIRHYAKYGKQLSNNQRTFITFNNLPVATRIYIILRNVVAIYWLILMVTCFTACIIQSINMEIVFVLMFVGIGIMLSVAISRIFVK